MKSIPVEKLDSTVCPAQGPPTACRSPCCQFLPRPQPPVPRSPASFPCPPAPAPHLFSARWSTPVSSGGRAARPRLRPGGEASPTAAARLPGAAPLDSHLTRPRKVGGGSRTAKAEAAAHRFSPQPSRPQAHASSRRPARLSTTPRRTRNRPRRSRRCQQTSRLPQLI